MVELLVWCNSNNIILVLAPPYTHSHTESEINLLLLKTFYAIGCGPKRWVCRSNQTHLTRTTCHIGIFSVLFSRSVNRLFVIISLIVTAMRQPKRAASFFSLPFHSIANIHQPLRGPIGRMCVWVWERNKATNQNIVQSYVECVCRLGHICNV